MGPTPHQSANLIISGARILDAQEQRTQPSPGTPEVSPPRVRNEFSGSSKTNLFLMRTRLVLIESHLKHRWKNPERRPIHVNLESPLGGCGPSGPGVHIRHPLPRGVPLFRSISAHSPKSDFGVLAGGANPDSSCAQSVCEENPAFRLNLNHIRLNKCMKTTCRHRFRGKSDPMANGERPLRTFRRQRKEQSRRPLYIRGGHVPHHFVLGWESITALQGNARPAPCAVLSVPPQFNHHSAPFGGKPIEKSTGALSHGRYQGKSGSPSRSISPTERPLQGA